jgi:hypothetical protein
MHADFLPLHGKNCALMGVRWPPGPDNLSPSMALAPPRRLPAMLDRSWRPPAALTPAREHGIDPVELILFGVFVAVSVFVLAADLITAATHGLIWTGTDGLFVPDQMQYLAWVRDSSQHVLASNLFVMHPTPHDYLQPIIAISGGLTALGVAPWLALLLWKPVAVFGALWATRAYVHRMLPDRIARLTALALALFFGSVWILGDAWLPFWSWGYPFGLMAIAAIVAALLFYARARSEGRVSRAAPLLGLLATWIHPWQGELLILMIVGAEALDWRATIGRRNWRRLSAPMITVVATALPLAYYAVLDHTDVSWKLARAGHEPHHALLMVVLSLAPLVVCALPAYRARPKTFLEAATRAWPVAALVVYGVSTTGLGATPLHAFAGITIPLGVLTVEGVRAFGVHRFRRWALAGALAAATIPASASVLRDAYRSATTVHNRLNFVIPDIQRAYAYLRSDPQPGGVLADWQYGTTLPVATGRHTYLGNCLWSVPNCNQRTINTWRLFRWPEGAGVVRRFVRSTGARFVLAGCNGHAGNLPMKLAPLTRSVRTFGCVTVYTLS